MSAFVAPQTLQQALAVLVCTFQRYAKQEGNRFTLSRRELRELLETELPSLGNVQVKEGAFEELMSILDTNGDEEVDFQEYIRFVAVACTLSHEFFLDFPAALPRGQ
ncbi:protein S100-A2-like isoform X2 [Pelodiscus sinensis]|uniref:protein S100-A2-like isoform X2 n=1 Tax=Pelodiscus sinensis TaxID=13735 RepID=UPI000704775E|nr:protein S100-A2-like [Pelodiscus sinensis]|eukprot:XP_014433499.1 protein S100-A2-like [Pelodiscus sinensis]